MRWQQSHFAFLERRWNEGATGQEIADELGTVSRSAVLGMAKRRGLRRDPAHDRRHGAKLTKAEAEASLAAYQAKHKGTPHIRKAFAALGDDTTFSRFVKVKGAAKPPQKAHKRQRALPGIGRPAVEAGRSLFYKKGIHAPAALKNLLVSAHSNPKIGRDVRVGKLFRGYWIYTLSLEERATCPRSCKHWADCYGNGMPYATRVDHRDREALYVGLEANIQRLLAVQHRPGILIRLHALGDFYDQDYVEFWLTMLARYERLAVFGYTARMPQEQPGDRILDGKRRFGRRFAIRFSDGGFKDDCTVSIPDAERKPANAFICPEQTGKVDGCGKCGLCWNKTHNVAFLDH